MLRWLLWLLFSPLILLWTFVRQVVAGLWPTTRLELRIEGTVHDFRANRANKSPSLSATLQALELASTDRHLKHIVVYLGGVQIGLGRAEELRVALQRAALSGKEVTVKAESLGLGGYWVALGATRIVLCPGGHVDVTGVASEFTLLKGLLDRAGIVARLSARGRYKSMREMFSADEISPENREMMSALVEELYGLLLERISAGRRVTLEAARELVDQGPFRAAVALSLGIVDELSYAEEFDERLKAESKARASGVKAYLKRRSIRWLPRRGPRIGVLEIKGAIRDDESTLGLGTNRSPSTKDVISAIRRARDERRIRALLVRVDSPGGSAAASERIWHALCRAAEKKPIVVSMADVAASGGYYVAGIRGVPIIANPTTITGSIGVVAGKWEARGLLERVGIKRELIRKGRHAGYNSPTVPWGPEEQAKLLADVDALYEDFVRRMAEARAVPFDEFEQVAQGRVWVATQAQSRRLVDELGGLTEASSKLRALLGLHAAERFDWVVLNRAGGLRNFLASRLGARLGAWWQSMPWSAALGSAVPWDSTLANTSRSERAWLRMPFDVRFK